MNHTQSKRFFLSLLGAILVFAAAALLFQAAQRPTSARSYLPAKFQTQGVQKRQLSLARDTPPVVKLNRISKVDSDDFPNDFEVELKNIGDKPIYFIYLYLDLPEVEVGGAHCAFIIQYGRTDLLELNNTANPDDESIKPGEVHTLKIATKQFTR